MGLINNLLYRIECEEKELQRLITLEQWSLVYYQDSLIIGLSIALSLAREYSL